MHPAPSLLSRDIGDVHKSVVEGGKDVSNTKDELTLGNLRKAQTPNAQRKPRQWSHAALDASLLLYLQQESSQHLPRTLGPSWTSSLGCDGAFFGAMLAPGSAQQADPKRTNE